MITKKQYLKAKQIILEYESQQKVSINKEFTVDDLDVKLYSIGIPTLTSKIVDEKFVDLLIDKLEIEYDLSLDYVNLEEYNFIVVGFNEMLLKQHHIVAVLESVNHIIKTGWTTLHH